MSRRTGLDNVGKEISVNIGLPEEPIEISNMQKANASILTDPIVRDVGIIALVPDRWMSFWEARHFVLSGLTRYFPVVWVDPSYNKETFWGQAFPKESGRNASDFPGLLVHAPERYLPEILEGYSLGKWVVQKRLGNARRKLIAQGCQKVILYMWRPRFVRALDLVDHDLSCYHMDDDYTFGQESRTIMDRERELATRVDQVFVTSPGLLETKGHLNPNTLFVPNGVDFEAFAESYVEPDDLRVIPYPRIGYVGVIKPQLDLVLLHQLAQTNPDLSFVLVGPVRFPHEVDRTMQDLSRLPNVYFLGPKPLNQLPAYQQHMDVLLLCYKVNSYTHCIYPLKLHQYLASGRPVIGSNIRSLQVFQAVIHLPTTIEEWSQSIRKAVLSHNMGQNRAAEDTGRALAQQHDWKHLVGKIAAAFSVGLGPSFEQRFQKILRNQDIKF